MTNLTIAKFAPTVTSNNRSITEKFSEAISVIDFSADKTGVLSSTAAFKAAIAYIKSMGGGTLLVPYGTYKLDVSSDTDALLIDFSGFHLYCDPGTKLQFNYYPVSLINFVGVNGGSVTNANIYFTGTRPASATGLSASHFGFNGTGKISPPDFASFISILGSSNVVIENVSWQGLTTSNLKEAGIQVCGGNALGPNYGTGGTNAIPTSDAVFSTDNKLLNIFSNDVAFGVTSLMQDRLTINNYTSDRYYSVGFVGAGHMLYVTGCTKNSRITNLIDESTQLIPLASTTFAGASTIQVRSLQNSVVSNVVSKRVEGLGGVLNQTQDCVFSNWHWSADRTPQESALANTSIVTVVQSDLVSTQTRNLYSNIHVEDQNNSVLLRSANCPIFGSGGASFDSSKMTNNVWRGVNITFYPDVAFGKSVITQFGQNEQWEIILNNFGTAETKSLLQLNGSAAGLLYNNSIDLTINTLVNQTSFNAIFTNSNGKNIIRIKANGLYTNASSTAGGTGDNVDKIIFDDRMYQESSVGGVGISRTPDLMQNSHTYYTLVGNLIINAPLKPYKGARLRFTLIQDATGGRVITWDPVFKKAADGAGAAGQTGYIEYVCDGSNWNAVNSLVYH